MIKFNSIADRVRHVVLLILLLICISTLTRITLLVYSASSIDFTVVNFFGLFLFGLFYDLINAIYFSIPFVLYSWLVPGRIYNKIWHHYVLYFWFLIFTAVLLSNAASEWFFWDEFQTRFNFIAVDYLVYTTEVIGNIQESYPITWIISGILIISGALVIVLRNSIKKGSEQIMPFKRRSKYVAVYVVLLPIVFYSVSNQYHRFSDNTYVNELAGNGLYELFAAYRNNELNYDQFYSRIETDNAFKRIRELIKTQEAEFLNNSDPGIDRIIANEGPEKRLNVILISVESFSAGFMNIFGNPDNLTPNLDSLAEYSLSFTNLYATGTRTVRGLEALSLCVPPTPGQSIVRRPDNEGLFTLGQVFNKKGYESKYIYGGYGYFDNMNYFFDHSGYTVVDRVALDDSEIDYENIWGVADENLFTLALHEIDMTTQSGKPIFAQVMTTSNHRPYTYPEGRIDIPSHTNRQGAVKYTDYAIGKFIRDASSKPWFTNTVFVIVADHCASSAGKTELPVEGYHIPMLIYSPAHIGSGKMERLMSQIDIGPTLLGLLNFSYESKFFGYDINKLEPGRERAFISTYQSLGYIKDDKLVILSPQQHAEVKVLSEFSNGNGVTNEQVLMEAISWYQAASFCFSNGLMKDLNTK